MCSVGVLQNASTIIVSDPVYFDNLITHSLEITEKTILHIYIQSVAFAKIGILFPLITFVIPIWKLTFLQLQVFLLS